MMGLRTRVTELHERIAALDRLMEAKFITLETLMQYQAEKVKLALDAAQTAIDKAEIGDEKARDRLSEDISQRFESVNEFRSQQRDIISTFMPRAEFDQFRRQYSEAHTVLRDQFSVQIGELKERIDKSEGRQGGVANVWGVIVAVAGIAIAIGALVFRNVS